jgi:tRNA (cytidine/uridine-2'-O-)-methyltransferase
MFNIVLLNPAIPGNTATTGRTALATNSTLHLIKPLGFEIDEKAVRRAGLDYWKDVKLMVWENLDEFLEANPISDRHFFATTKSEKCYFEVQFQKGDFIYFGREDKGLPIDLMEQKWENAITIPMKNTRSLNLAVSVGVVVYEALKQNIGEFYG